MTNAGAELTVYDLMAAKAEGKLVLCAKCRVPITTLTDHEGVITYTHGQSYRHHDHEAIPIVVDNTTDYASDCDFCGMRAPMHWTFDGDNVSFPSLKGVDPRTGIPIVQENDLGYRWSACAACGPLVARRELEPLIDRIVTHSRMMRQAPPQDRAQIAARWRDMHGRFLASIHKVDYHGPLVEPARLHPRLMPKIQDGLVRFWTSDAWADSLLKAVGRENSFQFPGLVADRDDVFLLNFPPEQKWPRWMWHRHTEHLTKAVKDSGLYWISSDFTQLSIMAGKDFDKVEISSTDLPSPNGLMIFDQPIGAFQKIEGEVDVVAVSWATVPLGVWINLYFQPEQKQRPDFDVASLRSRVGYLMCPNPGIGLEFDKTFAAPAPDEPDFMLTILAAWFLIAQPGVAEISEAPVDKKLARAAARSGNRLTPVKLVDLRRRPTRNTGATHAGRPLKVRVYRSGHWKNQPYGPKRGLRRHIYVSPYIAGPEGAPLKERPPVVKVLR